MSVSEVMCQGGGPTHFLSLLLSLCKVLRLQQLLPTQVETLCVCVCVCVSPLQYRQNSIHVHTLVCVYGYNRTCYSVEDEMVDKQREDQQNRSSDRHRPPAGVLYSRTVMDLSSIPEVGWE